MSAWKNIIECRFRVRFLTLGLMALVTLETAAGPSPAPTQQIQVIGGISAPRQSPRPVLRGSASDGAPQSFSRPPVRNSEIPDDWWRWIFVAALIFVGTGQLVILIFQTMTAGRTATAAKKAAEIAERMVVDFEAPFLFPVLVHTNIGHDLQQLDSGAPSHELTPEVQFTIKNFGRTPALLQRATAVLFFGDLDEGRTDPTLGRVNELMLEPQGKLLRPLERKMSQPLSQEALKSIKSGEKKIFLRGRITFLDVLGNRHEQTFCFAWDLEGAGFIPWGPHRNRRKRLNSKRRKLA
jgi:hypothetical protein